ncbi:MAG: SRPBCC domain-containing protein [Vulcanimicrobiaceae bacterium]|jgi:uncharacterized protein YndB with AHSA1/START domain
MMTTTTELASPSKLVLRRTFKAPVQKVFDLWTSADGMRQFFFPGEAKVTNLQVDFRVGGKYSITFVKPDGEVLTVGGVYREIKVPSRFVCTWTWEEDAPEEVVETLLTLEFAGRGNETDLVLTHEHLRSIESRDGHAAGWGACLDKLSQILA